MHGLLALTLIHERYLSTQLPSCRTVRELYHWSQCTSLLKQRLSLPIEPQDRDAIWGAAAALGAITFSSSDASDLEDSWPLRPSQPSDLDWMRLGDGKMALWQKCDPLRPDSLFSPMAIVFAHIHAPLQASGIYDVPTVLAQLCSLDEFSTAESNPFFTVAHTISQLYRLPDEQITTGRAFSLWRQMSPSYKSLLQDKDPVALLLLYLWYCRAYRAVWWIELRARVECPAIRVYLQRYHKENKAIQAFLPTDNSDGHMLSSHSGLELSDDFSKSYLHPSTCFVMS